MKTTNHFRFAITVLSIFLISSCKKTVENNQQSINAPNKAPIVAAGNDINVVLPANEILLDGSFYDSENNVKTIEWTKLSGPDAFAIENKNDLKTRVSGLAEGVYQFELTVTDHLDAIGKDVVTVTVEAGATIEVGTNEVIYRNLTWIYPWYSSLELQNIYSYVPQGQPIKVFVKRDDSTDWEEIQVVSNTGSTAFYEYFIEERPDGAGMYNYGSLYLFYYGNDTGDSPDVKVQF